MGAVIDPPPTPWREAVVHLRDGPRPTGKTKEEILLGAPKHELPLLSSMRIPIEKRIASDLLPDVG